MKPSRRIACLALSALVLSALPPAAAFAGGDGGNPAVKLTRGIVNLASGWLEVPNQVAERKNLDSSTHWWITHGLVRGFMLATARTLYGVYDILTFPVAPYDAPLMAPDTLIAPKPQLRKEEPPPSSIY